LNGAAAGDAAAVGAVLVVVGVAGAIWGARAATSGRRPLDLVGALVASAGVLAAAAGGAACLVPGFFG
jgi:hypothetical protein